MGAENINTWIVIYRGYTGSQIAQEQATLQRWLSNPYDSQTQGPKSYARTTADFRDRLAAIQRVINEQSNANMPSWGRSDASGGIWGAAGSQTYNGSAAGGSGWPDSWDY
jgi:hypothetical protein